MKNQFYRSCEVTEKDGTQYYAIFHRFERISEMVYVTESDGVQRSAVAAKIGGLVERTDGQMILVEADCIRFLDGFSRRIVKRMLETVRGDDDED